MRRFMAGGVVALVLAPAAAQAAPAATVFATETNQKSTRYEFVSFAGSDVADDVSFGPSATPAGVSITDPGVPILGIASAGGPGTPMACSSGLGSALCLSTNAVTATHILSEIFVDAGAGDDRVVLPDLGDEGFATALGGPGNDILDADSIEGGPGADVLHGGFVSYEDATSGVSVTDDGVANDGEPGEGDLVDLPPDRSASGGIGSRYDDTIDVHGTSAALGLGGNDVISVVDGRPDGGDGDDRITVAGTSIIVSGGDGDDLIDVRNGRHNSVDCGPGDDTVLADALDNVGPHGDCEHVSVL